MTRSVRSRALVNAAGPWAAQFLAEQAHGARPRSLRLVKGSHIVVPKLFDHDHAYIFQNPDQRIIFAIPYERAFTLIGTTDVEHRGDVGTAQIDAVEIAYLCEQASRYFAKPIKPDDVVWTYSGVRPLLDDDSGDPSKVTRDYQLELDRTAAPLLTIWGGKITTFRKLAEEAAEALADPLRFEAPAWTRDASLPGGDLRSWIGTAQRPDTDFARFVVVLRQRYPHLAGDLLHRLARAYGSRIDGVLRDGDLGLEIAPGLFEAELDFLRRSEWAEDENDVLWRRSKLGLHIDADSRARVAGWCAARWHDGG